MALIRWTPFRSVMSFRDEMDKLLNDFYGRVGQSEEMYEGDWVPAMDISETENDVIACLDIPGLSKEDIKVSVQSDVLTISGEKKHEETENKANIHRVERLHGMFRRVLKLPAEVDSSKVRASYKDGVLKVTLPKVEAKKPKEIPVQVT